MHSRLHYLDSIRGLAALSVLFWHLYLAYGFPDSMQWMTHTPLTFFWNGVGAVSLFFVLSGFVLTISAQKLNSSFFSFFRYCIQRVFRIVPLLLFIYVVSFFTQRYLYHPYSTQPVMQGWLEFFWHDPRSLKQYLVLVPQAWSLSVELPVSLFIPFLSEIMKRKNLYLFLFTYISIQSLSLNRFLLNFLLGIFLFHQQKNISKFWKQRTSAQKASILSFGILLYTSEFFIPEKATALLNFIFCDFKGVGCFFLLLCCINSRRIQHFLSKKILLSIGKISYGLYLSQFIFIFLVTPKVLAFINTIGISDEYGTRVISFSITTVCILLFSQLTYTYIEKPCILLGKKITSHEILSKFKPL